MITRESSSSVFFLLVAAWVVALLLPATPAHAQNVQLDLSSTSGLCGGQQCFNAAGIFSTGTTFLGSPGMDDGNNCTPTPPYTNCPDAYSAQQLFGTTYDPTSTTPPSITLGGVPFTFGTVNSPATLDGATGCGSTGKACIDNAVNFTGSGVVITLPAEEQAVYSTVIVLGTAVNGSHAGTVTATYTDGTSDVFNQSNFSDWCGFGGNRYESIAIGGVHRINSDGTLNGANCSLYAYTYPVDFTKMLKSLTLKDPSTSGAIFALAITLKPPTYTVDAAAADSATLAPGSQTTATITVDPQPGYIGTIQLACSISPTIQVSPAATAPTCSLDPTSVDVTDGEASSPTATLTFTASKPTQAVLEGHNRIFYALWLPLPGLAVVGLGLGWRNSGRRKWFGFLLLGLLLAGLTFAPGCVSYNHLGNVGTPPGQYTIVVTGVDANGLTQASNPTGTSNAVVVTVSE